MRKHPKRCSDTRGWVSRLPSASQILQPSPIYRGFAACWALLRVSVLYSSSRKRFRCRRYQERQSRETESSRCLPGPSAVVTTSKRAGEAPHKAWIDLTAPHIPPCQLQREKLALG